MWEIPGVAKEGIGSTETQNDKKKKIKEGFIFKSGFNSPKSNEKSKEMREIQILPSIFS
jgi:hypothetical protein